MSGPYRTAAPPTATPEAPAAERVLNDATFEELLFWERVYVSVVSASDMKSSESARAWATKAVLNRRAVFPKFVAEEREDQG